MSSIEEEDEPSTSDELTVQPGKLPTSSSSALRNHSQLHHSPSMADWDSELSESEQEYDDNDEDPNENGEDRAATRALQTFIRASSNTVCIQHAFPFSLNVANDWQSDRFDQGYLPIGFKTIHMITEGNRHQKVNHCK
jgi:hypothetical protein